MAQKDGAIDLGNGFGGLCQRAVVQRCRDRPRPIDRSGRGNLVCTRRFKLESECRRSEVLGTGSAYICDVPAELGRPPDLLFFHCADHGHRGVGVVDAALGLGMHTF